MPKSTSKTLRDVKTLVSTLSSPMAFNATFTTSREAPLARETKTDAAQTVPSEFTYLSLSYKVSAPTDIGSGLAMGRVRHEPVSVVRMRDDISPPLFKALLERSLLTVTFASATEKIELTKASITSIRYFTTDNEQTVTGPFEQVEFTFQNIKIQSLPQGVIVEAHR